MKKKIMKKTTLEKKNSLYRGRKKFGGLNFAQYRLDYSGENNTVTNITRPKNNLQPSPSTCSREKKILPGVWVFEKYVETTIGQRICDTIL